jgi:MFS family permease
MIIGKLATGKLFYLLMFAFCAILVLAVIAAMFFKVDENQMLSEMPEDEPETEEERMHREGKGIHIHATVRTSLVFLLIAVAMWYMAYGCIETNFSRYAVDNLGMNESTKAIPMLVATIASLICFVPLGILSSKIGRKKMILIGVVVLALAALVGSLTTSVIVLYILFAFIGVSWAAINVNSYPMVVEMAKGADIGRYTGYYYTFQTAAQIATPLFSGLLIDVFEGIFKNAFNQEGLGMRVLFPYSVVFLLLALVAMLFVKHGDSKETNTQKLNENTN